MAIEMLVALNVSDAAEYQRYRDAMSPILAEYGGEFRYDFLVSSVLRAQSPAPINRVFTLQFPSRSRMEEFFANKDYLAVKGKRFESSVADTTIIATYEL